MRRTPDYWDWAEWRQEHGFLEDGRILTLEPSRNHYARADEVSVGESFSKDLFGGIRKIVFAAFFRAGMSYEVAELDFHGEAFDETFEAIIFGAARCGCACDSSV